MNFLNKKIFSLEDKFFSLDISDLSIKLIELEREAGKFKVRSFSSEMIPEGAMEDGVVVKKNLVLAAIKKALVNSKPKKINSKKVICSLPESKAFLRIISIPEMKEDEAEEAVKWEIEASIPMSIDQVYFDWQFIADKDINSTKKEKKQNVLTVAVAKDVVDQLMDVLKEANLDVQALEIESVATARSLIEENKSSKESSLIVDLGAKRTSFIIVEGEIPYFTSSIPFSSENLTDAISKYVGINSKEAEALKISKGISDIDSDPAIFKAVEPLLINLIGEIEKTVDFYVNMGKNNLEIEKIIICGGGSNLKGLVPYLAKKLNKEIEGGDPWLNLKLGKDLPPISKEQASSYATVVGLAMRNFDYEN